MSKLEEFVSILTEREINGLEHQWVNIFREKADGEWRYCGFDCFADIAECRKWAEEYLTYKENNKNEILPVAKVEQVVACWARMRYGEVSTTLEI